MKGPTVDVLFRDYSQGDEPALIELWNRTHAAYGGFVAKTEERWRWSILQRGAATPASIVIATVAGEITAYGALAPNGIVLEFAVDTKSHHAQRRAICIALVENLEDRARGLQCDSLSFTTPASDSLVDGVLREKGYVTETGDFFSLGILNPVALVSALLAHPDHLLPATWNRRILVDIPPGGYPVALQSRILIDVTQGCASVTNASDRLPDNIDWHFKIDLAALTDVIFRLTDFGSAVQAQRIELDSRCTAAEAEAFFNALQIRAEWYTPPSDAF
jgi:hypothetical protein